MVSGNNRPVASVGETSPTKPANMTFHSRPFDLAFNTISQEDLDKLIDWLRSYPRLTMSEETRRFETAWSEWLGVRFSVMCNSGSSANLLIYSVLANLQRRNKVKVVVPAAGWATTISPAILLGFQPLMCEVDEKTYCLDIDHLARTIKAERPEVVMVAHMLGVPADMTGIMELKQRYGFTLIEDCCGSHGSSHKGQAVGTFGEMSSFSFYYGHHLSTIEGGIVSTNDEELYKLLLMFRAHGWLKDLSKPDADKIMKDCRVDSFCDPFTFCVPGLNLRPTEISAKLGLIQLTRLDEVVRKRQENHRTYQELLSGSLGFAPGLAGDLISSISFCAVADSTDQRKSIVKQLVKEEIDTRLFTAGNIGRHPFWTRLYGLFSAPVADRLFSQGFFLPNNQSLERRQIEHICRVVKTALN